MFRRILALALGVLAIAAVILVANPGRPALAVGSQIRTFVSTSGSDSNPCTLAAPCRFFSAALAQTASGGEVVALTTGGYGTLSISQSVTITAVPGVQAFIAPSSGAGVFVNAGASDTVILRNLTINGAGGSYGVYYQAAGSVHLENITVNDVSNGGIYADTFATAKLYVADVVVRNSFYGIYVHTASGIAHATVVRTRLESNNAVGLYAALNARITARDVAASGNGYGFAASTSGDAQLNLEGCTASGNTFGIFADSSAGTSTVRVSNCMVTDNSTGLFPYTGGSILSRGNNTVEGNTTNGGFSASYAAK